MYPFDGIPEGIPLHVSQVGALGAEYTGLSCPAALLQLSQASPLKNCRSGPSERRPGPLLQPRLNKPPLRIPPAQPVKASMARQAAKVTSLFIVLPLKLNQGNFRKQETVTHVTSTELVESFRFKQPFPCKTLWTQKHTRLIGTSKKLQIEIAKSNRHADRNRVNALRTRFSTWQTLTVVPLTHVDFLL